MTTTLVKGPLFKYEGVSGGDVAKLEDCAKRIDEVKERVAADFMETASAIVDAHAVLADYNGGTFQR
jgi:hypothetical protein